jgi:hypothetical protein
MAAGEDGMSRRGRIVVIVVVLACLFGAWVLDRSTSSGADDASAFVALGPRVPEASAENVAWYCAEGTSNPGGRADERVFVANVDSRPARARVSVFTGPDQPAQVRTLDIAPGALAGIRVADIVPTPDPGVVVETAGARAVVTHSITGDRDGGVGPCARDAAPEWHFAAGTTVRGSQLWLALFNPYGDDAIVNIGFLTDQGPLAPNELQGFVVPARSRVTVPVHDQARRDNLVATEVVARRGRVVAEQSQVFDGFDGRRGTSLSLGAPELGRRFEFATASVSAGRTETLYLANPGQTPASVTVRTRLDGGALEPETVSVAPRSSTAVDLGRRVPPGTGFSVGVRSGAPVSAAVLAVQREPFPQSQRGVATVIGERRAARRWIAAPSRLSTTVDLVGVLNPGAQPARVRFRVEGAQGAPFAAVTREIPAGRRVLVNLSELGVGAGGILFVSASQPVVVERDAGGMPGLTVSHAVPDLAAG